MFKPASFRAGTSAVGDEGAHVGIPCLEGGNLGGIIRHEADEDLIQLGGCAPVILVADKAGVTAGFPLGKDEWTTTHRGVAQPVRVVNGPVGFIDRAQDVRRQDAVPEICQPGGERVGEGDHHGLRVGGCHRLDIVIRIGGCHGIGRADCHLPGEDEVLGGHRGPIRPRDVIAQFHRDHAAVLADAAIFRARDLRHQARERFVVFVKFPCPVQVDLPGGPGEPHAGVQGGEGVKFLCVDQGCHFFLRLRHFRYLGGLCWFGWFSGLGLAPAGG